MKTNILIVLIFSSLLHSCIIYHFKKLEPNGDSNNLKIRTDGFYFIGDNSRIKDSIFNSYESSFWRSMSFLILYQNGIAYKGEIFSDFLEDTISDKKFPIKLNTYGEFNIKSTPNTYLKKMEILSTDTNTYFKRSVVPWCKYGINKDTLNLTCFNANTIDPFFPMIVTNNYKFLILNDSSLVIFYYSDNRFGTKNKLFSESMFKTIKQNKSVEFKDYYYNFYQLPYKMDSSKSFFNTNKRYLKYVEKQNANKKK